MRTYDHIRKIATGQGDDYTTGCLSDYNCFNNYYKMIATDLRKQQELDAYPNAIQQINFIGNSEQAAVATMFLLLKKQKEQF